MKKTMVFCVLATLLLSGCRQEKEIIDLPRTTASAEVVAAVDSFVNATQTRPVAPDSITLHSIMILKHGQVVYEKWFNGQTAETPHPMFSVSKTFTATAVGLAINEGKLNLTDPVVSFFPDKLPAEPSEFLKAMTVRDLLTMTCGHDEEPNSLRKDSIDWVEGFLSWPVKHKPGEYYLYNSVGTYMLSAIVQKVTGEKLLDYLDTRLFQPLHINRPEWEESPQGINCGGWGLSLTTEDMAKMGQLFLQEGKWNGKQLVPAEWLKEMSSYQVPSAPSGTRFEDLEKAGLNKDNNEWVHYPVAKLYKRELLPKDLFPVDIRIGEDVIGTYRAVADAKKIIKISDVGYYYFKNTESATSRFSMQDFDLITVWDEMERITEGVEPDSSYAILNRERINFTLLLRMITRVPRKTINREYKEQEKRLRADLKECEKRLLAGPIVKSRKVMIFMLCHFYPLMGIFCNIFARLKGDK